VSAVLALVLGGVAALAGGTLLGRTLRRMRSLRRQVLAVTLASLSAGAAVAVVLAELMVLEGDDLRDVVGVLVLTAGFASVLVTAATAPLGRDARSLETTVRAVEAGDRSTRSAVTRADELGHVAAALNDAIERLDALERERRAMFSSIGHDLRTPLAALRAALEAMEDGIAPDPDRYLRSMQRDVEALTALVDDVFLLSRLDSGTPELPHARVDLAEIADEAAEALAPVAEAGSVRLRVQGAEGAIVHGSAVALGRVIRNLVDNAIRHSPPGSEVNIIVDADADPPTVSVSDAGDGFPDGFAAAAFDHFSRADASRNRATGGAGLGLAIARRLVEAHGGRIWIAGDAEGGRVAFAVPPAGPDEPNRAERDVATAADDR